MAEPSGIVQSNPMNNTHGKHTHNYSSFPDSLAYRHYMTLRFGEYTPSFVMDGEPKDEISLQARHIMDSLSLNAPFKGSIRKITESFMVPKMAILPRTWDLIYTQPANGDDCPKDANCVIQQFPQLLELSFWNLYATVYNGIKAGTESIPAILTGLMRMLVFGEYFYSAGSLPAVCGYHSNNFIEIYAAKKPRTYDAWFDLVVARAFSKVRTMVVAEPVGGSTRGHAFVGLGGLIEDYPNQESFRAFLELFRENPAISISSCAYTDTTANVLTDLQAMLYDNDTTNFLFADPAEPDGSPYKMVFRQPSVLDPVNDDMVDMSQNNFNLSRILAYQLVCAHYYTNSAVDFVYTADLYRNYVNTLVAPLVSAAGVTTTFSFNGTSVYYDFFSGHFLREAIGYLKNPNVDFHDLCSGLAAVILSLTACAAIFGFRKSLRFGDYFVGSRPRPLAPINTDVSVNNNLVSVIDVTRGIQAQRFANAVMRSRSKIENYVRDLFGKSPAPDYHNPFYLTRQAELIYGDEVQNTADAQFFDPNSRTANFKSGDGKFMFTFHNDDAHPCVYLQIVSFDIKRAYTRSIDRHFMHLDRFDMFNPDFQYIGDQPVYGFELGYTEADGKTIPAVFGYQGRDMEYKQRFDVASGGFVENLPGWILTDKDRSVVSIGHLDPDFIRSYNTELDQFFLSLAGFSLGSYFHFIMVAINSVSAKRAMAVDPQILE